MGMGFFANRRARKTRELVAAVMAAIEASKPRVEESPQTLVGILTELTKMDLDRKRLDNELEIKRLEATHADREAARGARRAASLYAREQLAKRKAQGVLPVIGNWVPDLQCEECRAGLEGRKPAHERDMIRHATHLNHFRSYVAARAKAPGGERNAAVATK
jgi:hypothetical protein